MEGHQRAIMGQMTVEEIYRDRKAFSVKVFEVASTDLLNMGIFVVSYTLKDIRDRDGYLKALGMGRTAQVKRDARIGEATAKMESTIKEAEAEQQRMMSKFENDTLIAEAKREYDLRKAANDQEVQTQKAISDLARALQDAKTKQQVKNEEMKIKIIERSRQIELQEQEILRREKELQATVMKPAEAEKYKLEKLADAEKQKKVLEAEAEAESVRVRGEAKAFAIQEKAKAEAEQMRKKAEAWKMYQDAAMVDMVLNCLPKVAAEVAAPLTKTKKVTMVSSGGGEIGAAKLTGEVLDVVNRLPSLVESMTGVKLSQALASK
jgi:flotillin